MLELDLNLLAEIGGWAALKEARGLVARGRVSMARREGEVVRAQVQGAEKVYEAQIRMAGRIADVEVRCTCAESRRSGRVCAHALAAGVALLQGATSGAKTAPAARETSGKKDDGTKNVPVKIRRWLREDAPAEALPLAVTIILPWQFGALHRSGQTGTSDPVRIILEAQPDGEPASQPWDAVMRGAVKGFAVSAEDEAALTALEQINGGVAGISAIPLTKMSRFLEALDGHPRVWLGKKQRVVIQAATKRPTIFASLEQDGLKLNVGGEGAVVRRAAATADGVMPGWAFDGENLVEQERQLPGFYREGRVVAPRQIPNFLTNELPALERTCSLVFAPGFTGFQLEIGQPVIEARLEGALSGLTLELNARYGEIIFPLGGQTDASVFQRYEPDPKNPKRFWRRNILAERAATTCAEAASFTLIRRSGAVFSLIHENAVARFLANTLPRWRRDWTIELGTRLEATLRQIDVAQPEFSLRTGSGEDWLGVDLKLSVGGEPVPLAPAEIQRWLQTGQSHARRPNGRVLLVPTQAWGEMREVLADCEVRQEPGSIRVGRAFVPFLTGALEAQGFRGTGLPASRPLPEIRDVIGEELWSRLRPYQAQGVAWLAGLAQQDFHGLLADDMGLGKTLQALAFASWLRAKAPSPGLLLVICPTTLVTNWQREAARFTPHLRTLDLTGVDRAEKWQAREKHDLLITSYAILRRDLELYRAGHFSLVILDEAQHIKNRGSQNAQAAKALRAQRRLILSGTPLENSVLDLWSLYDFLLPGYLGSAADFRERYETPLTRGTEPRTMGRLRQKVRPFFLRRTKEEVLAELPPKLDFPAPCELSAEQREVYRAVLAEGRREVFEHSGKSGRGLNRLAVLTTLLRLRQVCCHLALLPQGDAPRIWKEPSAKLERTFELIDEAIDGGHRVLVFSQFVRMLHLLRDEARRRELRFCYLDGQTVERQAEVDRFQDDAEVPIFFISLKAGGTGLNLTGADTVIHFDPWWNPAVEEQATSRAHRMGQTRRVQAYKLIAVGTVEEKIQALQTRKREIFEASVGGDEALVEKLSGEDLEDLLRE